MMEWLCRAQGDELCVDRSSDRDSSDCSSTHEMAVRRSYTRRMSVRRCSTHTISCADFNVLFTETNQPNQQCNNNADFFSKVIDPCPVVYSHTQTCRLKSRRFSCVVQECPTSVPSDSLSPEVPLPPTGILNTRQPPPTSPRRNMRSFASSVKTSIANSPRLHVEGCRRRTMYGDLPFLNRSASRKCSTYNSREQPLVVTFNSNQHAPSRRSSSHSFRRPHSVTYAADPVSCVRCSMDSRMENNVLKRQGTVSLSPKDVKQDERRTAKQMMSVVHKQHIARNTHRHFTMPPTYVENDLNSSSLRSGGKGLGIGASHSRYDGFLGRQINESNWAIPVEKLHELKNRENNSARMLQIVNETCRTRRSQRCLADGLHNKLRC